LVVAAAVQILDYVGGVLIRPQSVLVHQYWGEIRSGFESAGVTLRHFILHAGRDELRAAHRKRQREAELARGAWTTSTTRGRPRVRTAKKQVSSTPPDYRRRKLPH